MIIASHGIIGSSIVQGDPDALAFFARVTAAGGTLSATEQSAILTLVADLKDDGLWSKMKAIYPMVGASAAACAQNLKSSSFTGTFNGGWTFASTGAKPNGLTGYMDTFFIPLNDNIAGSSHMSYYSRTLGTGGIQIDMGCYQGGANPNQLAIAVGGSNTYFCPNNTNDSQIQRTTTSQGFFLTSRRSSTDILAQRNATQYVASLAESRNNTKIFIGAVNIGGASYFSTKETAFNSIGDKLSDTDASNFYTAVQAFQTTLSRQV
jgi:hypothetical protein